MAETGQAGTALAAVPGGPLERVGAMAGNIQGRWAAMPAGRRNWMAASVLVMAALIAGMVWYAGKPDWQVLFSGLEAKDTQQIGQELAAAGIPYQMTEDGSGIEVSADHIDKARIEVATKGMPQSGRMGFELFDTPNWVGSEFDEKVNYQRALEGELEHTIGTLAVVRSARVHLVLPKDSLFGDEPQTAKASVVLQLRRPVMPPEQAEAIRNLVAGAVESLSQGNVTLVDADGRLNLAAPSQGATQGDAERGLEEKLVTMLEPTAGSGNVRATVNVDYDEGSEEKTDEIYDPSQVVPLSTHKSEQTMGARAHAAGVPGTASNTPMPSAAPGKATAAVPPLLQAATGTAANGVLPVYPQNGLQGDGATMTEETGSYAVTKHLLHSEQGPGRVRRVTAAVVVNDRMSSEGNGKSVHTVWKPRSPEEMQRLEQLARAAVGFDAGRGDQVVIENVSFSSNVPEATPTGLAKLSDQASVLLRAQPGLVKTLCYSVLGLLLVLAVLKPMTRQVMTALDQSVPLTLAKGQASAIAGRAGTKNFGTPAEMPGGTRLTDTQAIYEHISSQIRREPVQSTRLLESWISQPVEEEE